MGGDHKTLVIVLAVVNVPVYVFLAWCMFGGVRKMLAGLFTAVDQSLDSVENYNWADRVAYKIGFYVLSCAWVVYMEYRAIVRSLLDGGG